MYIFNLSLDLHEEIYTYIKLKQLIINFEIKTYNPNLINFWFINEKNISAIINILYPSDLLPILKKINKVFKSKTIFIYACLNSKPELLLQETNFKLPDYIFNQISDIDIIEYLVLNNLHPKSFTLHEAVLNYQPSVIKIFIEKNVPVKKETFKYCCENNLLPLLKLLLSKGTKFTFRKGLYWACKNNNIHMVKLLLQYTKNSTGCLKWACQNNNLNIVQLLLNNYPNIKINEWSIYWACKNNNENIVQLLTQTFKNKLPVNYRQIRFCNNIKIINLLTE